MEIQPARETPMQQVLLQLLPTLIIQCLLLIGIVPLARRVSPGGAWGWIVASLIPVLGYMVFMFLVMKALAVILERINLLSEKLGAGPSR
jgi:hypothetical protein